MINEMLLRRENKVYIDAEVSKDEVSRVSMARVAAIERDIQQLGYSLSAELATKIAYYAKNNVFIKEFYTELVGYLKEFCGANVEYRCMYPNFPQQVKDMDWRELHLNAIVHYLFPQWLPEYEKAPDFPLFETPKKNLLTVGTYEDIIRIFKNLVNSKTNISDQDKKDILAFTVADKNWSSYLPETIPHREVKSVIASCLYRDDLGSLIPYYLSTATDVLRFVVSLSNGDESLAAETRFEKMNRRTRRLIMDCLAGCGNTLTEDMMRYQGAWKRLGEIIHPGEFKQEKYEKVRAAFEAVRDNVSKPLSFAAQVEQQLLTGYLDSALELLKTRPGEFARKLAYLLRTFSSDGDKIIRAFKKVAGQVSVPVLLQVKNYFENENTSPIRVFFPKGKLAKVYFRDNDVPEIEGRWRRYIITICEDALVNQFQKRPNLGKVYIDPQLKNYVIPFSQRSASNGKKALTRGSRIDIDPKVNILRGFIHWTNNACSERQDIDLSAIIYDADWDELDHCSYMKLRSAQSGLTHSGDITNGGPVDGKGVAEFLDIDIHKAETTGARYIVFQIHNYTSTNFSDMAHCSFGWMERPDDWSGETFEPSTVQNKIDLTAETQIACPVIFDLKERQLIWCDMAAPARDYHPNNLENNLTTTTAIYYAMCNMKEPNLRDLVILHTVARGEWVRNKEEADTIFSVDEGITPYDLSTIMGELL